MFFWIAEHESEVYCQKYCPKKCLLQNNAQSLSEHFLSPPHTNLEQKKVTSSHMQTLINNIATSAC